MRRHAYETKMKAFSNGEYDIIIGTQMVAKGLDFENVTLVGVLSADQVLYSDDFRSNERGFDLMTQVVGRSGRGTKRGRAIIQTYTPENPVIALASHQDYVHFYQQEILFRKAMLYPPFADIVVIGFVGEQESKVAKASQLFLEMLSHLASKEYSRCISNYLPKHVKFLTCIFGELQEDKVVEKGTKCKMLRGEMVRYMAEKQINDIKDLQAFERLGYRFSPQRSDATTYVFLKHIDADSI